MVIAVFLAWQGEVVKAFYSRIYISGEPLGYTGFIHNLVSKKKKRKKKHVFIDATGGHGEDGVPTVQIWRLTVK